MSMPDGPIFSNPSRREPDAPAALPAGAEEYPGDPSDPASPIFMKPARAPRVRADGPGPWPWWTGLVGVVIAFGAVIVLGTGISILAVASGAKDSGQLIEDNTQWFTLAQQALWVLVVLAVAFGVGRHLRPEELGLRGARLGRTIGIGALMIVGFYVISYVYAAIFDLGADSNELRQDLGFGKSIPSDLAYAFVFTVGAPLAEELLFRGLLFRSLRDGFTRRFGSRAGLWLGALISGSIFGLIHAGGGQDAYLPMLMILGAILALAYHWSGTLYLAIVIHSFNNAMSTGFATDGSSGSATLNQDLTEPWIAAVIFAGPLIALLLAFLLARLIRRVFPAERPGAAAPVQPPSSPTEAA